MNEGLANFLKYENYAGYFFSEKERYIRESGASSRIIITLFKIDKNSI